MFLRGVEVDVALKVNVPNLVTYLNRSPLFEWCVVSDYMTGERRLLDDGTSCYPTTAVTTVLLMDRNRRLYMECCLRGLKSTGESGSVLHLVEQPIMCESKNGYQKDMFLKEIERHSEIFLTILGLKVNIIGKKLSGRFLTSTLLTVKNHNNSMGDH